jgi:hypothetical protein
VTRDRRVVGGDVLRLEHLRQPGEAHVEAQVLEESVQEDHPSHVELARRDAGHLPVEDRDRLEVAEHHVADSRVAPAQHGRGRVRGDRPVVVEPFERPLEQREAQPVARPLVVLALVGHVAPECGVPGLGELEELPLVGVVRRAVHTREHLDRAPLHLLALLVGCLGHPAPHRVWHDVGRHQPVDAAHHEERRTEMHVGRLVEHHFRNRYFRALAHEPHHLRLPSEVVLLEDGIGVGGRTEPGRELARVRSSPLLPLRVEQHRLARHPVGGRAIERRDRGRGITAAGGQPPFELDPKLVRAPGRDRQLLGVHPLHT